MVTIHATGTTASAAASTTQTTMQQIVITSIVGLVFGTAFSLTHVNEAFFVVNQMTFQTFLMLKMFLTAAATSTLCITYLSTLSQYNATTTRLSTYHRSTAANMIGAACVGIGMTLSGSCPGTVYSQLGALSYTARYTFAGCIVGTYMYGFCDTFSPFTKWAAGDSTSLVKRKVYDMVGMTQAQFGYRVAPLLFTVAATLEYLVPYESDLLQLYKTVPLYSIRPLTAGVMIGMLQLPLITLAGRHLGTSMSYCALVCNVPSFPLTRYINKHSAQFGAIHRSTVPYLALYVCCGIVLGLFAISQAFGYTYASDTQSHFTPAKYLLGGILLAFGARCSDGCTSGLGISYMPHGTVAGWIGVASMFAAAMATAIVM